MEEDNQKWNKDDQMEPSNQEFILDGGKDHMDPGKTTDDREGEDAPTPPISEKVVNEFQ